MHPRNNSPRSKTHNTLSPPPIAIGGLFETIMPRRLSWRSTPSNPILYPSLSTLLASSLLAVCNNRPHLIANDNHFATPRSILSTWTEWTSPPFNNANKHLTVSSPGLKGCSMVAQQVFFDRGGSRDEMVSERVGVSGLGEPSLNIQLQFSSITRPYPLPLVPDMGIQDLPFETLSQIFAIGCEYIESDDLSLFHFVHQDSQPRQMKPLAQIASLVCRDWYTIVHASSNRRLWITFIRHGHGGFGLQTPYENIAETKSILDESNLSDIDLEVVISTPESGSNGTISENDRIIIQSMALFIPYSHQLRVVNICSPPLRPILSALSALRPAPRLVLLRLIASSDALELRPVSVTSDDPLFDPSFECLDLSEASHCWKFIIRSWGALGDIIAPSHATFLDIRDCSRESAEVHWDSFVKCFRSASGVEDLLLDPIFLCDTPSLEGVTWTHSFQSVTSLQIRTDTLTICTIMTFFSTHSLRSLDLDLQPSFHRDNSTLNSSSSFSRSPGAPRPVALSTLKLNICDGHNWTRLHDLFIHVLLPRHISRVTLSPGWSFGHTPPFFPGDAHPSPIVSTLDFRWSYPSSDWIFKVSKWDAEVMEMTREGGKGDDLFKGLTPNGDDTLLTMKRLHKLSFVDYRLSEINTFTTYLNTPLLRDIDIRLPAKHILRASSKSISAGTRRAYHAVKSLAIENWSRVPNKSDLTMIIGSFINLISLHITIVISEKEMTVAHMGRHLQSLQDPCTCPCLEKLEVRLLWRSGSYVPDIAYRVELRAPLLESMSTFVDTREKGACSSVSAQLFEVTNHGEDSEETAVWNFR